jgi:hypothetical protein
MDNYVNLYKTQNMLAALERMMLPKNFLHETFFGTTVTHTTESVMFDYRKGKRTIAAFVDPLNDANIVKRDGFVTKSIKPAYTKEADAIRPSDTQTRLIGENPFALRSPLENAGIQLREILTNLNERVSRLEEKMCRDALFNGEVVITHRLENGNIVNVGSVDFGYVDGVNKITLSGTSLWTNAASNPLNDLDDWYIATEQRSGLTPNVCVLGTGAGRALMQNEEVRKVLDNTRMHFGIIAPRRLPNGVSYLGTLLIPSGTVELYTYNEWYIDPITGEENSMVPNGAVLLGSTESRSAFHYGMIQNMHALTAVPRFPYSWVTENGSARWVQMESSLIPALYEVDAFTVATVI